MRRENLLLAALPDDERDRLDRFLEPVYLEPRHVLIEPNEPIRAVYFPFDCVSSTVQVMEDGSMIETGLTGVVGLVGLELWLRVPSTSTRSFVQVAGDALRMTADDFVREVLDGPSQLNPLVARYAHAFLFMTSQIAACNRLHTVDARLCRWLKLTHNRIRRDDFEMRQEFLAAMLGVQRPTVSIAAGMLQRAGLITYSRGRMRILNAEGLRAGACECLERMERQFDRIFDRPWRELAARGDEAYDAPSSDARDEVRDRVPERS